MEVEETLQNIKDLIAEHISIDKSAWNTILKELELDLRTLVATRLRAQLINISERDLLDIIYVVSTVRKNLHTRVVGWFRTLEEAKIIIVGNYGDIWEMGYYPYAIIEKIEAGLYPTVLEEYWYEWREYTGYTYCAKPEQFKNMVNWGIG